MEEFAASSTMNRHATAPRQDFREKTAPKVRDPDLFWFLVDGKKMLMLTDNFTIENFIS